MKASDYLASYLKRRGVTHVFELVGGMITFLLDALHRQGAVQIVSMHHEQGAGFAAEGYSRIRGVPGVAMATSGPGATNLLTAIGSCYFDSTAAVFVTGQVNRHEQKGERAIRQLGFQETDIVSIARPITKAAWMVSNAEDLPRMLDEAFALATSGRPGPVLLDLPMDVQRGEILEPDSVKSADAVEEEALAIDPKTEAFLEVVQRQLSLAHRPLILVGGGVRCAGGVEAFRGLAAALSIPVVNSLLAVDVLPSGSPVRVGLIGSYGNRWANIALGECDFLLVLGSRLDVRQTGADTSGFKGQRFICHVDCEPGELNNRITGCVALVSDLRPFLARAIKRLAPPAARPEWLERISSMKSKWPDIGELPNLPGLNPNVVMRQISTAASAARAFVADVGQHQMWAAQSLRLEAEQRFLTSGGMGAMGFALPAAIGAAFAAPGSPIVVIAGDGGFQLNIQELQTVVRCGLPLKMFVLNNGCHGMVRQFQEAYFKGRYQSTLWGYTAPSFAAIGAAYGIASEFASTPDELSVALVKCWADPSIPFLVEIGIATEANAYPKMAFGRPISEMEPFAKPLEMEGT